LISFLASVLGRGIVLKWVARVCAAAEDIWAEVQANRQGQQLADDPAEGGTQDGGDEDPPVSGAQSGDDAAGSATQDGSDEGPSVSGQQPADDAVESTIQQSADNPAESATQDGGDEGPSVSGPQSGDDAAGSATQDRSDEGPSVSGQQPADDAAESTIQQSADDPAESARQDGGDEGLSVSVPQSGDDPAETAQGSGEKELAGQVRDAEDNTRQVLESLFAEPLRGILGHTLPALEYHEVVRPLLAEIDRVYARIIFRSPTFQEVARHVHGFYERFPTLEDRWQAIRAGNIRPSLGIRPLTLEIDVTNQCNLRCVFCHFSAEAYSKRKREDISVENFAQIAKQAFPFCHLVHLAYICEPLLHPQFGELVALTKSWGVPYVTVTTNGLLLNEQTIEQLISGGLEGIAISMDGATKPTYERIRRKGNFDKLIGNMSALQRAKQRHASPTPHLALNFVMMRSNIAELPAFIRLAHEIGAVQVTANHLSPFKGLNMEAETMEKDPELCNRMMDEARALAKDYQIELLMPARFEPPAPEPLLQIGVSALAEAPKSSKPDWARFVGWYGVRWGDEPIDHCFFPWHFLSVSHDGSVIPCPGWHGPPIGNILEESFEGLWNSDRYQAMRSDHLKGTLNACWTCPAAGMGNPNDQGAFVTMDI
jgi:radical SAM protein with 4Fe4S-binding SPASM domain